MSSKYEPRLPPSTQPGFCYLELVKVEHRLAACTTLGWYPTGWAVGAFYDAYKDKDVFVRKKVSYEIKVDGYKRRICHITVKEEHSVESVVLVARDYDLVGGAPLTTAEPAQLGNSLLASVIASPRGGYLTDTATFRRYTSGVVTEAMVRGCVDTRQAVIHYEVGRRFKTITDALAPVRGGQRVDAAYHTGAALAEDFVGLAKKYSNFSATFEYTSLAAIVERLARCLAVCSTTPGVTSVHLRGGEALHIQALGTHDGPVNSLVTTVFIPRLVNSNVRGDVFSVLVNAVAGEGGSVSTDVLEVDAITRQPIIPEVEGDGLPRALVDALRVLGSNMIASGQGPLFALAFTRGIHKVLTVVSHTDEGGVMRDLLRAGSFGVPFGGIHYGLADYVGIPALSADMAVQTAAYVDGIALATAGLVAHCDPGERYDGRWFPTFYSGSGGDALTVHAGTHVTGTAAMAARNHGQLISGLSRFADLYISGLGELFSARGDTRLGSVFFCTAGSMMSVESRHLRHASIAPWFWVEPTSLIPAGFVGSSAETEGFASYGGRDSTATRAAWEDIVSVGPGDVFSNGYHVLMRSARTAWFLAHWVDNPRNGLGCVTVRQLDPLAIVHPGPCDTVTDVRDRVSNTRPLSDFLWKRGQSPFPAPSEFLNLTGTIGLHVRHSTLDDDCVPQPEHVPAAHEFVSCTVTIRVGRPTGRMSGPSNTPGLGVRRAKTHATRELAAASARMGVYGRADVGEMPILMSAPRMREARRIEIQPTPDLGSGAVTGHAYGDASGADGASESTRVRSGAAVLPVPHHAPLKAPAALRPGINQPGGGVVAIPAGVPPAGAGGPGSGSEAHDSSPPGIVAPSGAAPPSGPDN
nr:MAG: hypothetical protein H4RhizoLitter2077_000001 [Totiviridae sp.]